MQKPQTLCQAGVCGQYYSNILPHPDSNHQESRRNYFQNHRLAKLLVAIEQKNLHDCLKFLEEAGFGGEVAPFMLGYIQQSLGVE